MQLSVMNACCMRSENINSLLCNLNNTVFSITIKLIFEYHNLISRTFNNKSSNLLGKLYAKFVGPDRTFPLCFFFTLNENHRVSPRSLVFSRIPVSAGSTSRFWILIPPGRRITRPSAYDFIRAAVTDSPIHRLITNTARQNEGWASLESCANNITA